MFIFPYREHSLILYVIIPSSSSFLLHQAIQQAASSYTHSTEAVHNNTPSVHPLVVQRVLLLQSWWGCRCRGSGLHKQSSSCQLTQQVEIAKVHSVVYIHLPTPGFLSCALTPTKTLANALSSEFSFSFSSLFVVSIYKGCWRMEPVISFGS